MPQTDWDFENASWTIDPTQYVSAPSSVTEAATCVILSRRANCQVLPQGQLITQVRGEVIQRNLGLTCRNQAALGAANSLNCYTLQRDMSGVTAVVTRYEAGAPVWFAELGAVEALLAATWYKFRFTWWINWGKVRFRLERWTGVAWVQDGVDVEDPANKWAASAVNRLGLVLNWWYAKVWYDDTELWGP